MISSAAVEVKYAVFNHKVKIAALCISLSIVQHITEGDALKAYLALDTLCNINGTEHGFAESTPVRAEIPRFAECLVSLVNRVYHVVCTVEVCCKFDIESTVIAYGHDNFRISNVLDLSCQSVHISVDIIIIYRKGIVAAVPVSRDRLVFRNTGNICHGIHIVKLFTESFVRKSVCKINGNGSAYFKSVISCVTTFCNTNIVNRSVFDCIQINLGYGSFKRAVGVNRRSRALTAESKGRRNLSAHAAAVGSNGFSAYVNAFTQTADRRYGKVGVFNGLCRVVVVCGVERLKAVCKRLTVNLGVIKERRSYTGVSIIGSLIVIGNIPVHVSRDITGSIGSKIT